MKKSWRLLTFALAVGLLAFGQASAYNTLQTLYTDWRFSSGLTYGFSGDNHVYDHASYLDFYEGTLPDYGLGGTWLGTNGREPASMHWSHALPALNLPNDRITRARLWIDGAFVDNNNNMVNIGGTWDWDPLSHQFLDNTTYNLGGIDDPSFWNDGQLEVTVQAGEYRLRIDRAILMVDYEQGPGNNELASVPEPATLILFGSGLVGAGILARQRRRSR